MKPRTGQIFQNKRNGAWIARVCYTNKNGKRTAVQRQAESKTEARKVLKDLLATLEKGGRSAFDIEKLTVNDLCEYYLKNYVKPAQIINGRKVSGLRGYIEVRGYIKVYCAELGGFRLKDLAYEDLRNFRDSLLSRSTQQSVQISIATVNRYLAYLRRMLSIAERKGWIVKNLFRCGDTLIHQADEIKRTRVLTLEESQRLVDCCTGRRSHIRPLVIAALDTGCRYGELASLRVGDVDFEAGVIHVLAENTKTFKSREVGLTARLRAELEILWKQSIRKPDALIFGRTDFRHAFKSACEAASLENLRFHDLRRCHATRLDELGFSIATIGKQLGHSGDYKVTIRYISRDKHNIQRVVEALDQQQQSSGVGNL